MHLTGHASLASLLQYLCMVKAGRGYVLGEDWGSMYVYMATHGNRLIKSVRGPAKLHDYTYTQI